MLLLNDGDFVNKVSSQKTNLLFLKFMSVKILQIIKDNYKQIYLSTLLVFVAVLPHSRFLLSISEIALFLFWLLDGNFSFKFQRLKKQPEIWVFASVFLLHLVGLLYTEDFNYAAKDLRTKLPLLLFPIILGTSKKFSAKEIKLILFVFVASLIAKTLYGLLLLSGLTGKTIADYQKLSGRFSHIRYALLLNIGAFLMLYYFFYDKVKRKYKAFYLLSFVWLSFFIFLLHSVTGWVIGFVLFVSAVAAFLLKQSSKKTRFIYFGILIFVLLGTVFYVGYSIHRFYKADEIDFAKLDRFTEEGNEYLNNKDNKQRENGHYVYIYLCEKELKEAWNKRSNMDYDGKDRKNQFVKYTLIRYMTSKNLRKDKKGVLQLSSADIQNIENGMTNYLFANKFAVYPKIYEILWQLQQYFKDGNPENQSVSQRLEFWENGVEIIKRNFWFGTGTGDVQNEFNRQYEMSGSQLSEKHRMIAHNQYLTVFITFGLFGFVWFLFALFYPLIKLKKYKSYLFMLSFIVIILSMFNEDTLDTQMGTTIFAFFLSLFLFADGRNEHASS